MFRSFVDMVGPIVDDFKQSISGNTFALENVKGFPFAQYEANRLRYIESMSWFSGEALEPEKDSNIDDYPVRINPINGTCLKHAYALFGDFQDDGRPLIVPKLVVESGSLDARKAQRAVAQVGESALNRVWWENFGRTLMMRNAIVSQILGGSVFHIRFAPEQAKYRTIPIQIERIAPECFCALPLPGDEFRLRESWTVKRITHDDALQYGVEIRSDMTVYWIEKWLEDRYEITINGNAINYVTKDGVSVPGVGPNKYGFVPSTYVPHIRVGRFYGENVIDPLRGIVKEMNLRYGDTGDAFNADTHTYSAVRNVQGNLQILHPAPGLNVVDLGSAEMLAATAASTPDMMEIKKQTVASPMIDYMKMLEDQYRRDANHPKVADGEDEGSQRSAATLIARMWPLVSHIQTERINWSCGLDWFSIMLLRTMKEEGLAGITDEHVNMRTRQAFAPILPKDREMFINEIVGRAANKLGSPQHLIEMTGDVEDVEEEIEMMLDFEEKEAKIQAEANPKPLPGATPPSAAKTKPNQRYPSKGD